MYRGLILDIFHFASLKVNQFCKCRRMKMSFYFCLHPPQLTAADREAIANAEVCHIITKTSWISGVGTTVTIIIF